MITHPYTNHDLKKFVSRFVNTSQEDDEEATRHLQSFK